MTTRLLAQALLTAVLITPAFATVVGVPVTAEEALAETEFICVAKFRPKAQRGGYELEVIEVLKGDPKLKGRRLDFCKESYLPALSLQFMAEKIGSEPTVFLGGFDQQGKVYHRYAFVSFWPQSFFPQVKSFAKLHRMDVGEVTQWVKEHLPPPGKTAEGKAAP